jgi:hypothetical protein
LIDIIVPASAEILDKESADLSALNAFADDIDFTDMGSCSDGRVPTVGFDCPERDELRFTGRIREARNRISKSSIRIGSLLTVVVTVDRRILCRGRASEPK